MHTERCFAISLVLHVVLLALFCGSVRIKTFSSTSDVMFVKATDYHAVNHKNNEINEQEHIVHLRGSNKAKSFHRDDSSYDQKNELDKDLSNVSNVLKTDSGSDKSNHVAGGNNVLNESASPYFVKPVVNNVRKKHHIPNKVHERDVNHQLSTRRKVDKTSSKSKVKVDRIVIPANDKLPLSHVAKKRINRPIYQNEVDIVRRKIIKNWNIPPDLKRLKKVQIKIHLRFNRDGSILDKPYVKIIGGTAVINRILTDNTVRAVMKSQPFFLPSNKYENWRNMTLNFAPSKM